MNWNGPCLHATSFVLDNPPNVLPAKPCSRYFCLDVTSPCVLVFPHSLSMGLQTMAGSVMLGALLSCGVAKPSPPSLHVECLHVYPLITCLDDFEVDIHIRSHSDVLEHPWLFWEVGTSNAPGNTFLVKRQRRITLSRKDNDCIREGLFLKEHCRQVGCFPEGGPPSPRSGHCIACDRRLITLSSYLTYVDANHWIIAQNRHCLQAIK